MAEDSTKKIVNIETSQEKMAKSKKKDVVLQKEKSKRIITNTNKWTNEITMDDLDPTKQRVLIEHMYNANRNSPMDTRNSPDILEKCQFIRQQINQKIYGYRAQDLEKSLFCEEKFVDYTKIIEMFIACDMKCYYCKTAVSILYEYVREPKQWTVERIDNKYGHNKDNVEIACLNCNLHRRTMYHERYMFTKNLNIVKKGM